jgi:endonuclease/exonuclease/phosphatase family metal-dependent hydrolase
MKLVTYNIRFGLGTDQRIDLGRIAETVRDADIIGLQEVERFWKRSGMTDQPEILGRHLKDFYWVYCPVFDVDASERKSDGTVANRRRQFGPMLLSRWPIRASRVNSLPKLGTATHFNMDTGGIECVVDTPSGPLRVYSVHLSAVSTRERLLQIERLLECHRHAQTNGGAWTGDGKFAGSVVAQHLADQDWSNGEDSPPMPRETIVMGDFNSEPESDEYEQMVGKIDPSYGRVGHLDSFVDSWTVANDRSGDGITWWPDPPERSPGHGLRLDYCFVDPHLGRKVKHANVDSAAKGSDHRPYWVELDL